MQSMAEHYFQQGREQGIAQGKEQGIAQGREQGIAQGREQGIAQGREQGIAQGREQGEHQMSIESTLNILTERFSNVDADELRPKLEAITDISRLKQLILNAAIADSFNAFQETLNAD